MRILRRIGLDLIVDSLCVANLKCNKVTVLENFAFSK